MKNKLLIWICLCSLIAIKAKAQADLQKTSVKTFRITENQQVKLKSADTITELKLINSNYYIQHLGFFCREELKVQKTLHQSVILRAGSVNYNNWIEQKPGYQYIPYTR